MSAATRLRQAAPQASQPYQRCRLSAATKQQLAGWKTSPQASPQDHRRHLSAATSPPQPTEQHLQEAPKQTWKQAPEPGSPHERRCRLGAATKGDQTTTETCPESPHCGLPAVGWQKQAPHPQLAAAWAPTTLLHQGREEALPAQVLQRRQGLHGNEAPQAQARPSSREDF